MKLVSLLVMLGLAATVTAEQHYPLRDAVECTVRGGLPNSFAKLAAGRSVRIAYLGGSITAQPGWRPLTLRWFREQHPQAQIEEINAAIGGTGSDLGVFRLQHDVLDHHPDLLFVEFAVNDGGAPPARIRRSMEGIVRQTWKADPETDICFVYTLTQGMLKDLQSGKFPRAASAMEELADHYGIPSIHMGLEVARLEQQGKLVFKGEKPKTDGEKASLAGKILFSRDGVHPYPETGHPLYLQAVQRSMAQIQKAGRAGPHRLGDPLVADNWEQAKMLPLDRAQLSQGWEKLDPATNPIAKRFANRVPSLWKASHAGDKLTFRFKGVHIGIYDLLGPDCGQVSARLDDGKPRTVRRIDGYCTYHRLAMLTLGSGLPEGVHTNTIQVLPEAPDKRAILFERNRADFDRHPKKYEGINWYAGALMVIGEPVE